MPKYVIDGMPIKCACGGKGNIKVLPLYRVYSKEKPMATVMENVPMLNIPPLGNCKTITNPTVAAATAAAQGKLQEMPCIPNTVAPWTPGKMDVLIGGNPALTDDSQLMCMWGGVITFEK